ncbi:hypothetical protein PR048_019744 [Dryococelus australis]|uniref:Myrosinase 1-like n=1 Tax=Dryococelus australis TaxID=614101 RepID=A0ABQ9H4B8_9NEOP|nr:hypothetical protein PR048_019744 [Dryococelus australis]
MKTLLAVLVLTAVSCGAARNLTFPDGFMFGAGSAAYQIEGAWNTSGKGESIWDRLIHTRQETDPTAEAGDIAADSYHHYKEDVQAAKDLGLNFYRFSVSWSRILPKGDVSYINQDGIDYYNNLINELKKNNIEPLVTMYHWDLPQHLQDLGGLANDVIIDYFEDYARLLFTNFGDRVKWWATFNEPLSFVSGYTSTWFAPGVNAPGVGGYLVGHNVLKAHARVYHLYDKHFRSQQEVSGLRWLDVVTMQGLQRMDVATMPGLLLDVATMPEMRWLDVVTMLGLRRLDVATMLGLQALSQKRWPAYRKDKNALSESVRNNISAIGDTLGWFAHPIYSKEGDYPAIMKDRIAKRSKDQGLPRSRLPEFDDYWVNYIRGGMRETGDPREVPLTNGIVRHDSHMRKSGVTRPGIGPRVAMVGGEPACRSATLAPRGTYDFYGMNMYSSYYVSAPNSTSPSSEISTASDMGPYTPFGLRKMLKWVSDNYNKVPILITENGWGDVGELNDTMRIRYLVNYYAAVLDAIYLDNVTVLGHSTWSLIDTFIWGSYSRTGFNPQRGHSRIFACGYHEGRCRRSEGFLRDLPFHTFLHSGAAAYSSDLKISLPGIMATSLRLRTRILATFDRQEAVMVQWLDHSPTTIANRAQFPAESLLGYCTCESYQTMPLVGGYTLGSPIFLTLPFWRCCILA